MHKKISLFIYQDFNMNENIGWDGSSRIANSLAACSYMLKNYLRNNLFIGLLTKNYVM
jgi:hypothetical protein